MIACGWIVVWKLEEGSGEISLFSLLHQSAVHWDYSMENRR